MNIDTSACSLEVYRAALLPPSSPLATLHVRKGTGSPLHTHTLLINPRRACAARVTVVGSVCVSVKSHLTSGASVRPEKAVTYSGQRRSKNLWGFL